MPNLSLICEGAGIGDENLVKYRSTAVDFRLAGATIHNAQGEMCAYKVSSSWFTWACSMNEANAHTQTRMILLKYVIFNQKFVVFEL